MEKRTVRFREFFSSCYSCEGCKRTRYFNEKTVKCLYGVREFSAKNLPSERGQVFCSCLLGNSDREWIEIIFPEGIIGEEAELPHRPTGEYGREAVGEVLPGPNRERLPEVGAVFPVDVCEDGAFSVFWVFYRVVFGGADVPVEEPVRVSVAGRRRKPASNLRWSGRCITHVVEFS